MTKRTCPACGGRKDFYALRCRGCAEWRKPLLGRSGAAHPAWRGGQMLDKDGYLKTYDPAHPYPRKGGYVREHIRVMELQLGRRLLRGEVVHHIDGDIRNNAIENLMVMQASAHSALHRSTDAHLRQRDPLGRFTGKEVAREQ